MRGRRGQGSGQYTGVQNAGPFESPELAMSGAVRLVGGRYAVVVEDAEEDVVDAEVVEVAEVAEAVELAVADAVEGLAAGYAGEDAGLGPGVVP